MSRPATRPIKIVFRDPMGEWHENPDPAWLKRVVMTQGSDFWEAGAGEAAIDWLENDKRKAVLYLKSRDKYGFVVDYDRQGSDGGYQVLRDGDHTGEVAQVIVAGDEVSYWREHFVPRQMAWKAIEHFLETGDRDEGLSWEVHDTPEIV